jgi:hypothetical protein
MHERMMDKSTQPGDAEMLKTIGEPLGGAWNALRRFLVETYAVAPIFNSGGKKYGWNLQYRLGSRPLCEMYLESGSFTVLVILGKLELEKALQELDDFTPLVRQALLESPRFHDGCWMYMRVLDPQTCGRDVESIQRLILIKKRPARR